MRNPVNSSLNLTGRSPVYSVKSVRRWLIITGSVGEVFQMQTLSKKKFAQKRDCDGKQQIAFADLHAGFYVYFSDQKGLFLS